MQLKLLKASLLLSVRAFAQLVTFIAILPLLDLFVSKKLGLSARVKDFLLSRMSIVFIMICFAILVLAPNISVVVVGKCTKPTHSKFQMAGKMAKTFT